MENSDDTWTPTAVYMNWTQKSITELKRGQNIEATKQEVMISRGKMAVLETLKDGHITK